MLTGLTVTILQYIQIFCKPKTNVICHLLAWEIPWTEENGGLQSMGHKESDRTEQLSTAEA